MAMKRQVARTILVPVLACAALLTLPASPARAENCASGPTAAARENAASIQALDWSPFGRAERGWAIYAPLMANEIHTLCPAGSPGFAAAIARWQSARRMIADGRMSPALFAALNGVWLQRRPFVRLSQSRCPDPPFERGLATASPPESYGGKTIQLTPAALAAYRRMVAAARAELPSLTANRTALTIFSAYRSPAYDDERCARQLNCDGVIRAPCSAHRTGLAIDLNLGAAPGYRVDDSSDANRLYQSRMPAYRWMVRNARRFGFVNYAFEPWHWEWAG